MVNRRLLFDRLKQFLLLMFSLLVVSIGVAPMLLFGQGRNTRGDKQTKREILDTSNPGGGVGSY